MNASFGSHVTCSVSPRPVHSLQRRVARPAMFLGNALSLLLLLAFSAVSSSLHAQANYAGTVSALAPGGSIGGTDFAEGVAFDATGNLYVADGTTQTVYRLPSNGNGTYGAPVTLATGFINALNIAIDPSGNVWVSDFGAEVGGVPVGNGQVYEIASGTTITTPVTPTAVGTGWNSPDGIASDSLGNIFVSDNGAGTLSEIPSGSTTATSINTLANPHGLAIDPVSGTMYIAVGSYVDTIPRTGTTPFYATAATTLDGPFGNPIGVAIDSSENLWVADYSGGTAGVVWEFTAASSYAFASGQIWGYGLNGPVYAAPDNFGNIIVSNQSSASFEEVSANAVNLLSPAVGSGTSATVWFNFTGASTTINAPVVTSQGGTGEFTNAGGGTCAAGTYTIGQSCSVVVALAPTSFTGVREGAVQLQTGSGTIATGFVYGVGTGPQVTFNAVGNLPSAYTTTFSSPSGIATDAANNVYVANAGGNDIVVEPAGGGAATVINNGLSGPQGVAVDGAGNIFIADTGHARVVETTLANGTPVPLGGSFVFTHPNAVAVDVNGNVFVADGGSNSAIEEITAASGYTTVRTLTTTSSAPIGVAIDYFGNVFFVTSGATSVSRLAADPNNGFIPASSTVTSIGTFSSASAIALDHNINLYVLDSGTISEFSFVDNPGTYYYPTTATTDIISALTSPVGIAVDGKGNVYYTNAGSDNKTYTIDLADAPTLTFNSSAFQTLSSDSPKSVVVGNIGNVLNFGTTLNYTGPTVTTTTAGAANSFAEVAGSGTPADCSGTTSLSAGTYCNLSVSFTPQLSAAIAGTATLTDNDLNGTGVTQTIALNGTGTKVTPTITWPTASGITYGQALSASTLSGGTALNGATTVNGTFAFTTPTTVPLAGTDTESVTFTPTDTTDYNTVTGTVTVVVSKATPTVTWPTASGITYGQALSASTLSGGSALSGTTTVNGNFAFTTPTTVPTAGTDTESVTFTPTDTTDYSTVTGTVSVVVSKATPTITWPTASAISFGQTLAASTLSGGSAINGTLTVNGNFAFTAPTTAPPVGTNAQGVIFTPTDTTDYNAVNGSVNVTVNKATPTVTWPTASALTYGQALSASTLSGGSAVSGTTTVNGNFAFTTPTTVPTAGTDTESVTFTPTNTTDYSTVTGTVSVVVSKATPAITWPTASAITYGQTLASSVLTGGTALNGTTSVNGTFNFTTPTTAPTAGTHAESVTFSPTDTTDYNPVTGSVNVTVNQATPTITWHNPAAIAYGTALSATQLNATANVPGTFTYTPAAGVVLPAGANQTLSVSFAPTDTTDYKTNTATVTITVTGGTLTLVANSATRVYGTANPAFSGTISGQQNGDTFTESFTTTATITSNVGTYAIVPSATGTNLADYTVVTTNGTLTITKANTTTSLMASGSAVNPGATLTLTATVASATSGTPTGIVSFYDGATLLGTGTLSGGVATYSTTTLAAGVSHAITASYSGDINFNASNTANSIGITVGVLDFTLGTPTPATQSGNAGTAFTYTFSITPTYGTYAGTVNFAATGLPSGGLATFSPSSIPANGGPQTVTMIVSTVGQSAALVRPSTAGRGLIPVALAFLLLPLAGTKRMRREGGRLGRLACLLFLVLAGLGVTTALTGCGSHAVSYNTQSQSYTVTITATSGSIQHTATVTLDLQQ